MTLFKKKLPCLIAAALTLAFFFTLSACANASDVYDSSTINIVSTTTMLTDLAKQIGGDKVTVYGLMGSGVDPHQYRASAGDITKMSRADMAIQRPSPGRKDGRRYIGAGGKREKGGVRFRGDCRG